MRVAIGVLMAGGLAGAVLGAQGGCAASPEAVAEASPGRPGFNYEESRVPPYTLPDVLGQGPSRVTSREQWPARRAAILELFREHVYGRRPGRPDSLDFEV